METARVLLQKAELELQSLKVNPDDITKIVALGKLIVVKTDWKYIHGFVCVFNLIELPY